MLRKEKVGGGLLTILLLTFLLAQNIMPTKYYNYLSGSDLFLHFMVKILVSRDIMVPVIGFSITHAIRAYHY